jgi:hypothetical protein
VGWRLHRAMGLATPKRIDVDIGRSHCARKRPKILLGAISSEGAPSPDCVIKAAASHGECIYHLPGDRWYAKMRMDSGKRWFCSVTEAEAAGCRAPKS